MEILTTASGIGGLIAFIAFCIFIPFCLSGNDSEQNEFGAMAWFVVGMAAAAFLFGVPDWRLIAAGTPVYFAIGVLWFLWRWRQLILRKRAEADEAERKMAAGSYPGMTREKVRDGFRPQASDHKERIAGWILLWPWGMLWTVVKWPWRLAVKLAEWARGLADRMVDQLWTA